MKTLQQLCHFQHWLGTNYTDLPTDSTEITKRAIKYLKELASSDDAIHQIATDYAYQRGGSEWYDALYAAVTFGAKSIRDGLPEPK